MKIGAFIGILSLLLTGCITRTERDTVGWNREGLVEHTWERTDGDSVMTFRFHDGGFVAAVFRDKKEGWTMGPLLRWRIENERLLVFDDIAFSYAFTLLEKRDGEVQVRTAKGETWAFRDIVEKKPNQPPEPTPTAGTSAAEQPLVPAAVVAHL